MSSRHANAAHAAQVNHSMSTAVGEYPSSSVLKTSMVVVAVTVGFQSFLRDANNRNA
jgi:hypothetical protein